MVSGSAPGPSVVNPQLAKRLRGEKNPRETIAWGKQNHLTSVFPASRCMAKSDTSAQLSGINSHDSINDEGAQFIYVCFILSKIFWSAGQIK